MRQFFAFLVLCPIAFAQSIIAPASTVNGVPASNLITICNTNPKSGTCSSLVLTYTDITLTTSCAATGGTLSGTSCSNPGNSDNAGNIVAFAASGQYWCQYKASTTAIASSIPCSTGGGASSGTVGPGTQNFYPVFSNGSGTTIGNGTLSENAGTLSTTDATTILGQGQSGVATISPSCGTLPSIAANTSAIGCDATGAMSINNFNSGWQKIPATTSSTPPLSNITALAASSGPLLNANFNWSLQWQLTGSTAGISLGESTAGTGTGALLDLSTLSSSTIPPFFAKSQGFAQLEVCPVNSNATNVIVGSAVACTSQTITPIAKLNVMATSTGAVLRVYHDSASFGGTMQPYITKTAAGTGWNVFTVCPGTTTTDTSCNASIISTLRGDGLFTTVAYATTTNCAAVGTAANPSVASCSAAAAGAFSCATNASGGTCQVNTTAVTTNSEIFIQEDASLGARLGVTCNTTNISPTSAPIASRVAATSFTINLGTVSTNPECFSYHIIN